MTSIACCLENLVGESLVAHNSENNGSLKYKRYNFKSQLVFNVYNYISVQTRLGTYKGHIRKTVS